MEQSVALNFVTAYSLMRADEGEPMSLVHYRVSYVAAFAMVCLAQCSLLLGLVICGWAVITALSRALMGRHYIGDVVVGLLLGMITTAVVTQVIALRLASSSMSVSTPTPPHPGPMVPLPHLEEIERLTASLEVLKCIKYGMS